MLLENKIGKSKKNYNYSALCDFHNFRISSDINFVARFELGTGMKIWKRCLSL